MVHRIACLIQADRQIITFKRNRYSIPGAPHSRLQHTTPCSRYVGTAGCRRGTRRRTGRRWGGHHGACMARGFHHHRIRDDGGGKVSFLFFFSKGFLCMCYSKVMDSNEGGFIRDAVEYVFLHVWKLTLLLTVKGKPNERKTRSELHKTQNTIIAFRVSNGIYSLARWDQRRIKENLMGFTLSVGWGDWLLIPF